MTTFYHFKVKGGEKVIDAGLFSLDKERYLVIHEIPNIARNASWKEVGYILEGWSVHKSTRINTGTLKDWFVETHRSTWETPNYPRNSHLV